MRFIDEATIEVRSGNGGDGRVSFRREKFVPKGGPDGGDGGRGGDVVLRAHPNLRTLLDYHYKRKFTAENGQPGGTSNKTGRGGKNLVLDVPVGTMVFPEEGGEPLGDLAEAGQELVVAVGGAPGAGNQHFALPWRQTPYFAKNGGPGESKILRLELKLLADVGLVGLPNAGKSTLINGISAAKAKVADYPFTTLVPNLGVVAIGDQSFVVADMPGLIKGAADGVGLGLQFLRHCERTSALVHLVDVSATEDPLADMAIIREELANYGKELDTRPWILVASKVDMPDVKQNVETLRAEAEACGVPFVAISTFTGEGVKELVSMMARSALDPDSRV
ncbi:MAG TPA: GTPase ObgE [Myxococcota bacterium]|nr:GTPase ObgE [Myxococcota bacterium]HON26232.1 GTPase ObgE [Myxococcota bacterium]HOS63002.1 GTPase ObgE [Myxococcota bacterium]HPC93014.1 GTPase ObgE [Myxococcota bacterium]HPL26189.1 GTPase ObgE [Myxococcota bacterium]